MTRFLASILLCTLTFASCSLFTGTPKFVSQQSPYRAMTNVLGDEYFHSPNGDIAGLIPTGWLHVNPKHLQDMDNLLAIYTDKERGRALVLTELPNTAELRRNVERDGLRALASESFVERTFKAASPLVLTRAQQVFTVNDKLFATYEYALGSDSVGMQNRVAVFTTGARFYDLAMIALHPQTLAQSIENFQILESVIGSLEGVAQIRAEHIADSVMQ